MLLTYLSATHCNRLPGSAGSSADQVSFCTCYVIQSFWLLSNTYPPPQLIWLSRCEPAPLSQQWKRSSNSTFLISNGIFNVNKPFSTYLILENIKNEINRTGKKDSQMSIQSYQLSLSLSFLSLVGYQRWVIGFSLLEVAPISFVFL